MFTGLVKDRGTVRGLTPGVDGTCLTVTTALAEELGAGDSLAVNGVCLTVEAPQGDRVAATVVPETLGRTTLGRLRVGDAVNLEPALRLGDPMGGHIVQGHVDGTGRVVKNGRAGSGWTLDIDAAAETMRYVAQKGSIAIDGVSLTVAAVRADGFSVVLVPLTLDATVLADRRPGDAVNLEVDILAKYVERMLATGADVAGAANGSQMTERWLRERGY